MDTIEEIKSFVAKLSREELSAFRNWFQEYDSDAWDREIEEDVAAGRLDAIADEAMRDFEEGRCTELCITDRNTLGIVLHPQYITDEEGNRISVILPIEEYEALTNILAA